MQISTSPPNTYSGHREGFLVFVKCCSRAWELSWEFLYHFMMHLCTMYLGKLRYLLIIVFLLFHTWSLVCTFRLIITDSCFQRASSWILLVFDWKSFYSSQVRLWIFQSLSLFRILGFGDVILLFHNLGSLPFYLPLKVHMFWVISFHSSQFDCFLGSETILQTGFIIPLCDPS